MPSTFVVKSYLPTKKWFVALVTGLTAIGVNLIESGSWDKVETGMLSALALSLASAYIKKNDPTPEGVPTKRV